MSTNMEEVGWGTDRCNRLEARVAALEARTAQDGARGDAATMEHEGRGSSVGRAAHGSDMREQPVLGGKSEDAKAAGSSPAPGSTPSPVARDAEVPTRDDMRDGIMADYLARYGQDSKVDWAGSAADTALSLMAPALSRMREERDAAREEAKGWMRDVAFCVRDLGFPGSSEKPHVLATRVRSERDQLKAALSAARRPTVGVTEAMRKFIKLHGALDGQWPTEEAYTVWCKLRDELDSLSYATHALVEVGELERLRGDVLAKQTIIEGLNMAVERIEGERDEALENVRLLKADIQKRRSAAPSAGDVEACLSAIMAEPNNCGDRDHIRNTLRRFWPHPSRTPVVTAEDVKQVLGIRGDEYASTIAAALMARLSPPAAAEKTEGAK